VLAPWVVQPNTNLAPWTWQKDDVGTLVAHAMVTQYYWVQPIANYEESIMLQLISVPNAAGELPLPELPAELATYQPAANFQINPTVSLYRFEPAVADPLRHAEQIARSPLGSYRFEQVTGNSSISVSQ
jgi:hypothetical protein